MATRIRHQAIQLVVLVSGLMWTIRFVAGVTTAMLQVTSITLRRMLTTRALASAVPPVYLPARKPKYTLSMQARVMPPDL